MAKVIFIIEDKDDDDGVSCRVEFDPPVDSEEDLDASAAQSEAVFLLEVLQRHASGETLAEMAVDMDQQYNPGSQLEGDVLFGERDDENVH